MKIGLAILPDAYGTDAIIAAQAEMSRSAPMQPTLSTSGNLPHISLLQCEVDADWDGSAIINSLADARLLRAGDLLECETVFVQKPDWVFLGLYKAPSLVELQWLACRQMAAWLHPPAAPGPNFASYSDDERASYLAYGYRYIGASFLPHVTLGRCRDAAEKLASHGRVLLRNGAIPRDMTAAALTVYRLGDDGAHAHTLARALLR